ncbi:MAG: DNA cytosine methyltransferase [Heteroscytonema crispum UTEX LB 1556]
MSVFKVVDLFCGCGGLSWGFKSEGFQVVRGIDKNAIALKTFARNFPEASVLETDLSTYSPQDLLNSLQMKSGELDCLIGGPPCQGFSKNVPARERYQSDERNQLIITFLNFVKVLKPKMVLIENVAEMKNAFEKTYTNQIQDTLKTLGYNVKIEKLLAADYGVPQLRRRTFFWASLLDYPINIPKATHLHPDKNLDLFNLECSREYVTVWSAISDLPSLESGEGKNPCDYQKEPLTEYQQLMRKETKLLYDHIARQLTQPQLDRVKHLEPGKGQGVEALPEHLRPRSGYSGAYARLIPNEPARTITRWVFHPGSGRFYHPFDNRVITIREAARLQSFPDKFIFEGTYIQKSNQLGEAVPPLLAQAFAKSAKEALLSQCSNNVFHKVG